MVDQKGENNLKQFREDCRSRAAKIGHTLEEECDIVEKYTGCKEYADAMRELIDVKSKLKQEIMGLTEEECESILEYINKQIIFPEV